jgi:LysM repeat protein
MKKYVAFLLCFILIMSINTVTFHAVSPSNVYVVKSGDTLPEVAGKYGTSVKNLKLTNGLQTNLLVAGQKLVVPISYEVNSGDTLSEISSKYNTSVYSIKAANRLQSDSVYIGQKLRIAPKRLNMQGQYILMTREEFRKWLSNNQFNRKISLIQQHHTWLPSYKHFNGSNHFQMLKGMENFHVKKRKWKNIAQNITTFPDGKIAISRPLQIAPEGSIGPRANSVGIAIEHIGNFDIGHDVMTKEQKETIVYITALLSVKFGLTPSIDSITYHHWWDMKTGERVLNKSAGHTVKSCPGTGFFGGNTTISAKRHFYPLVTRKMEEIRANRDGY